MSRLKWSNIPLPPQHLVGLVLGTYLHFRLSQRLFSVSWMGIVLGWPLIAIGIWISVKAAIEAGEMSIDVPTEILTTGLYSRSRNPMYVGWFFLYLGIALAVNSVWIMALIPFVSLFTHYFDIRSEERVLESEFGDHYLAYKKRVRRYL